MTKFFIVLVVVVVNTKLFVVFLAESLLNYKFLCCDKIFKID